MKVEGEISGLRERTKKFALDIIRLSADLPRSREADIVARQVVRSGTSVGANYREACRARSKVEFGAKIGVIAQEADETLYWLDIINECNWMNPGRIESLITEADELVAIFTAIGKRSKS